MKNFNNLPLKSELLENLTELKYLEMTPIQEKAIPIAISGKDLIAQAKTGSGKTAAFMLGILNNIELELIQAQALIICPTRELAEQVAIESRKIARKLKNLKILTLCGGVQEIHQEKSLSYGAHIIVATPGRLLRFLKNGFLETNKIKTLVLDEADRMLDMGFYVDMISINKYLPKERQALLFSATFPDTIKELSKAIQNEAEYIQVDSTHEENAINENFIELSDHADKANAVKKVLAHFQPKRFLIFCKTKQITDKLAKTLNSAGIEVGALHGDHQQNERVAILTKFSNESFSGLIATDVAARGLDIKDLPFIINYDLSNDPEIYVHRIGRTARAGQTGDAISLFITENSFKLQAIEDFTGKKNTLIKLDSLDDSKSYEQIPKMKTIYISGGKKNKLRAGDILGALIGVAGIESDEVGNINILNIHTYVAISRERCDHVIKALNNGKIKNKKFKIGLA